MKKIIIGSLVGAILLFGWQGLSWMVMGIHDSAFKYSPAQDSLLTTISNSLPEEGQYFLPRLPDGASESEKEAYAKSMKDKPWAVVTYHKAYKADMVMPMIRGFLICFVCIWICCVVIGRIERKNFWAAFSTTLSFGVVSFLFVWYMGHNWMDTGWDVLTGELIDSIAGWGLAGIWLGWWYSRK